MPIYEYQHPKTGEIIEFYRPAKDYKKDLKLKDGTICKKMISSGIQAIDPTRIRLNGDPKKEAEWEKRVKDPERARKNRIKKFGSEGTSITKSEFYKKEKRIKAQGKSDVSKKDFIQNAARNPNAIAAALKVTKKN